MATKSRAKQKLPPEQPEYVDRPCTDDQMEVVTWFAQYKNLFLPPDIRKSNALWWLWLKVNVTHIDRENAYVAMRDFPNLKGNLDDPTEVIGILKYAHIADSVTKTEKAKQAILRGSHPYEVDITFSLNEAELAAVIKDIETNYPDFEIVWGSV